MANDNEINIYTLPDTKSPPAPVRSRKEGIGWHKPPEKQPDYEAADAPFRYSSAPDSTGKMELISYINHAGKTEWLHNMTETEGRSEIGHREDVLKNSGEHYYFVESDIKRYGKFHDKEAIPYAHSTHDNKLRRRSNLQSAIVGEFKYDAPELWRPWNWYDKESGEWFKMKWRKKEWLQDPAFYVRSGLQTLSLLDIFAGVATESVRNLADWDAQRSQTYHSSDNSEGYEDSLYHIPDREEVQDWLFKPEGPALEQFTSMLASGGGISGITTKVIGTFRKGKRYYHTAARNTLRKMQTEKLVSPRAIRGPVIPKPSVAQLTKLSKAERTKVINKYKVASAQRQAYKQEFQERVRREYVDTLNTQLKNKYMIYRGPVKFVKKARLNAVINPRRWAFEAGLAEIGLNGSMVLANHHLSSQKDDAYSLFGPMNMLFGVAGAMASGNIFSALSGLFRAGERGILAVGEASTKGKGFIEALNDLEGTPSAISRLMGEDGIDAIETIVRNEAGFDISKHLAKYPRAKRKRLWKLLEGVSGAPEDFRQKMVTEAKASFEAIEELKAISPHNKDLINKIEFLTGSLLNNRFLMLQEETMIPHIREAKTVSLNIAGKESVLKSRRAQNMRDIEGVLDEIEALGSGTQFSPTTTQFLNNIHNIADDIALEMAPKNLANMNSVLDDALEYALEEQANITTLFEPVKPRRTVGHALQAADRFRELKGLYKEFATTVLNETQRALVLKKIGTISRTIGADVAYKRLQGLKDASGKGLVPPDINKVQREFTDTYYSIGYNKKAEGSQFYEDAKHHLKHLSFTGTEAEDFFLGITGALRVNTEDKILRKIIPEIKMSTRTSLKQNADEAIKDFASTLDPNVEDVILQRYLTGDSVEGLATLIRAKRKAQSTGRKLHGIEPEEFDHLMPEVDVLNQYDLARSLNNIFGRYKGRQGDALKRSTIGAFKNKHNKLVDKFENAELKDASGATIDKAVLDEYEAAKKNYKENVIPATINNRLWQAIDQNRLADVQETYGKESFKILKNQFFEDPHHFMEEATRLFGKYDPAKVNPDGSLGGHVLDITTDDGSYLDKAIRTIIDNEIMEQGEKIRTKVRLKPITPEEWKDLKIPKDIDVRGLKYDDIIFGEGIDHGFTTKLKEIQRALKGSGIDIHDAIHSTRDYDRIINENLEAQVIHSKLLEELGYISKNVAREAAVVTTNIKKIQKVAEKVRADGLGVSGDFVEDFVIGSPRALDDLHEAIVVKGGMSEFEFGDAMRTLTATGLRRRAEVGGIDVTAESVAATKDISMGRFGRGVRGAYDRTLAHVIPEVSIPYTKIDPDDPRKVLKKDFKLFGTKPAVSPSRLRETTQQHKAFTKEIPATAEERAQRAKKPVREFDLRTSRQVDGNKLLEDIQQYEPQLTKAMGYGTNEDIGSYLNHMKVVAKVLSIIQRNSEGLVGPSVLKASRTTIGGTTSRLYAVFSGRVSWRYVGIEALYMHMARNEAAAIAEILADPDAAKAIAYMAVYGKPIINTIRTSDHASAWLGKVAMRSSEHYFTELDNLYAVTGTGIPERLGDYERELRDLGIGSRKEGIGYQGSQPDWKRQEKFFLDRIEKNHKGWTAEQIMKFYERERTEGFKTARWTENLNLEVLRSILESRTLKMKGTKQ